jgi:site-specific DNA-methyltransferase (adenine-specific)
MGKGWDEDKGGRRQWIAWLAEVMGECLRVLKPGGHAFVWALPKTSHWTATALEDAGFEIRDCVLHVFGSGFPKSLNVGKSMEGQLRGRGARYSGKDPSLETVADQTVLGSLLDEAARRTMKEQGAAWSGASVSVTTDTAKQWEGWGTALKPASEHWWLVRKPLVGTVAANVERYGTGALNIDASRVAGEPVPINKLEEGSGFGQKKQPDYTQEMNTKGRWPPNLLLSHSESCEDGACADDCAVAELDRQSGFLHASGNKKDQGTGKDKDYAASSFHVSYQGRAERDYKDGGGGASRFFPVFKYQAKPSRKEREAGCDNLDTKTMGMSPSAQLHGEGYDKGQYIGFNRTVKVKNNHPTVKPVALMEWLITLVTPPNGVVLDPFMGSGTTGIAAVQKGFNFIGIEREAEYLEIARARLAAAKPPVEKAPQPEQLTLLP